MIAFKGFTSDLTARMGKGIFQFREGETYTEGRSKCAAAGFHCAENPFDCLNYYPLGEGNRYFMVNAQGDMDEDEADSRIACTKLELLREISLFELAGYGMTYMINHPKRPWEKSGSLIIVAKNEAKSEREGFITIARGKKPKAWASEGSVIGLIKEEHGVITKARVAKVGTTLKPKAWYTLDENGEFAEVADEEKRD